MAGIMDELGKAVSKLQDLGEKALDGAKDLYDKARPTVEDTFEKVTDGAKNLADKARPVVAEALDRVGDGAKNLADKAKTPSKDGIREIREQLSDEVKAQVEQIRGAANGTDSIHDFIKAKYGKPETPAADEAVEAMESAADAAKQAAEKVEASADAAVQAVGEAGEALADRVQQVYEQVSGQSIPEAPAPQQEAPEAPEAPAPQQKAPEIILEGPTPEQLAEVFETVAEEPLHEEFNEE